MPEKTVLVTGGCGFIGSCFIRSLLDRDESIQVINLDLLTYAGDPGNVGEWANSPRYRFVHGDIRDAAVVDPLVERSHWVVNFAAESHVDRSAGELAGAFVETNVHGVFVLLDSIRRLRSDTQFLQIGTDEVYGDIASPLLADESAPLAPTSPYSASKAGGDHIAMSFLRTHGLDVRISRCTNNYGPFQYPEKLIPLFITNALEGLPLPLYDGGGQIRDWLRVSDHCAALHLIMERGQPGEIYNIGASHEPERTNVEIVRLILEHTNAPESLVEHRSGLRPGHDQRYAVSSDKLRAMGWSPRVDIEQGIAETVQWYTEHRDWWQARKDRAYREFYSRQYDRNRDTSPS